mmetsp:Transcript_15755/g.41524  ORF Transcript_15755/g.41524 Transcript_15755/m.41524 type:complete len:87 (-) Transcript_15755:144-404(-)|eukprot:171963-Pelagomonas_calceolata.AAC.6
MGRAEDCELEWHYCNLQSKLYYKHLILLANKGMHTAYGLSIDTATIPEAHFLVGIDNMKGLHKPTNSSKERSTLGLFGLLVVNSVT